MPATIDSGLVGIALPSTANAAQLFNAFDRKVNDITYYYESQLPGEAAPVEDIHFHPAEPRTLRATIHYAF